MADLGNLFFSLGLDTKQIDAAWDAALRKYGQKAQVDLKLNTGDMAKLDAANEKSLAAADKRALRQSKIGEQVAKEITAEQNLVTAIENTATAVSKKLDAEKKVLVTTEAINTQKAKTVREQATANNQTKQAVLNEQRVKTETDRNLLIKKKISTEMERQRAVSERLRMATERHNASLSKGGEHLGTQGRLLQNLNTLAASYVSIFAGARIIRELVTITGEFELQKVALQAILGDLNGANKIFDQIKELAVKSPFQFKDLVSYTKQLSAFSIPMNELYDTTKMLADVSAGLGVGMDRLVLAYGQIRAASVLRGQEVRQLTEAGIPVIEELRKKFEELGETGLTAADIFDKISNRLVPFEMIKEMFTDMTSEGGKFFMMQEIQAETLKGKVSNLTDAYQIMMAEIGKSNEGVLKGAVDVTRQLIENYDKVGKAIMDLAVAYGTYKAAIAAATLVQKVNLAVTEQALVQMQLAKMANLELTKSQILASARTKFLTAGMHKLKGAVSAVANPYTLLGAAIAGVAFGIYKVATADSALEAAQKSLNKTLEKTTELKTDINNKAGELASNVRDETKSIHEQIIAFNELIKKYEFFQKYSIADIQKMTAEEFKRVMAEFGIFTSGALVQGDYEAQIAKIAQINAEINNLSKSLTQATGKEVSGIMRQIDSLKKDLRAEEVMLGVYKKRIADAAKEAEIARVKSLPLEKQAEYYEREKKYLNDIKDKIDSISPENRSAEQIKTLDETISKIYELDTAFSSLNGGIPEWAVRLSAYLGGMAGLDAGVRKTLEPLGTEGWGDYIKRLRDEWGALNDGIRDAGIKGADDLISKMKVLKQVFSFLGVSPETGDNGSKKQQAELERLLEAQKKFASLELNLILEYEKAKVDAMEDGWEKENAVREYQHKVNIQEIQERAKDLLEAQAKAGGDKTKLSPENQGIINQMLGLESENYRNEQKKAYNDLLADYQDFEAKRKNITIKYNSEVMRLVMQMNGKNTKEIGRALKVAADGYAKDLKEIDNEALNSIISSSNFLQKVFGDLSTMTRRQLRKNVEDAKLLLAYITRAKGATLPDGVKPEDVEKMVGDYKAIARLQKIISDSQNKSIDLGGTPLGGFIEGFKLLKLASKETETAVANSGTQIGDDAERAAEGFKDMASKSIISAAIQLADMLGNLADRMTEVAEATGNMKMKEFAAQMKDVSGFFSDVGKGFQQGGWIGAVIAAVFSAVTKTIDAFQQAKLQEEIYKQDQLNWAREYQNILLELDENDYESIFGITALSKSVDAYRKAAQALQNYNDVMNKRTAPDIEKERTATGIATFFGFGGGMNAMITKESQLALEAYKKGLTDIQRLAVKTKDQSGWANFFGAKDEYKTLFDLAPELWGGDKDGDFNIKAAKAFLETNTQITEEQRKQIQNLITQKEMYDENVSIIRNDLQDTFGHLGDSLLDALQNAIETGADSFDMFEDAGAEAIEKLGRKLMYEIFLAERFDKFQEDLAATYKDDKLDTPEKIANAQIELMDKFYNGVERDWDEMTEFNKRWQEKAAERGFNIFQSEDAKKSTLGGAIQASVTENTANLLGGYINGIRADGAKRTMLAEQMLPLVSNINDTMGNGLAHLAAISSNTFRSAVSGEAILEKLNALTSPSGATRLNAVIKTN